MKIPIAISRTGVMALFLRCCGNYKLTDSVLHNYLISALPLLCTAVFAAVAAGQDIM